MSNDPRADIAQWAAAYRQRPTVRTVVSHAVYELCKNDPRLGMQHLVDSGHITTWDTAEQED